MNSIKLLIILLLLNLSVQSQEKTLKIEGVILDENEVSIPYAAIGIPSKYVGTSSNEDGNFYLELSRSNLLDTLEISSIGYLTSKIIVKDLIALNEKIIILEEDIVSLDEVRLMNPVEYVELALKHLKENTVSSAHELKMLNRFFALENDKAKFFIEHYIKVKDIGPKAGIEVRKIEVVEGRKSEDYRGYKNANIGRMYPLNYMYRIDPLRRGISLNKYKWTQIGDTSYDGEDIVIIQGVNHVEKRKSYLDPVLYIGVDTYKVYKTKNTGSTVVYIYQKNNEGKLYLNYHNHYTRRFMDLSEEHQKILKTKNKQIKLSKKNEVIVLGIETSKKKIKTKNTDVYNRKMEEVNVKYDSFFWKNFSLPPATEYYKNSIKELEANFGVDIETQFQLVNKN